MPSVANRQRMHKNFQWLIARTSVQQGAQSPRGHLQPVTSACAVDVETCTHGLRRGREDNTGVSKCSKPSDFFAYFERLCVKLQANLTVRYVNVAFTWGFPSEPRSRSSAVNPAGGSVGRSPSSPPPTISAFAPLYTS